MSIWYIFRILPKAEKRVVGWVVRWYRPDGRNDYLFVTDDGVEGWGWKKDRTVFASSGEAHKHRAGRMFRRIVRLVRRVKP